jgi:hypothetical protein
LVIEIWVTVAVMGIIGEIRGGLMGFIGDLVEGFLEVWLVGVLRRAWLVVVVMVAMLVILVIIVIVSFSIIPYSIILLVPIDISSIAHSSITKTLSITIFHTLIL